MLYPSLEHHTLQHPRPQDQTPMTRLRFVHSADLHLDSPFKGIRSEAPSHVAETLSNATFDAYRNIIDLCLHEKVDALLVAGDIYDGADRSLRAQLRFVDGLAQLDQAGIRSFICHGNHDPLDGWEARLDLPEGCVRFGPAVKGYPVFPDEPERAMVYGVSYPTREMRENLTPLFAGVGSSRRFSIGLLHANVGANPDHDPYAPCSVTDLVDTGLEYWALGHVHTRQTLREDGPTIVYPGNPQGRHPNEPGARGVYLVEVDDAGAVRLDFRPVDVVRWETLSLDIGSLEGEQALLDAVDDLVEEALSGSQGCSVVVRLELTGRGQLNGWLRTGDTVGDLREQINDRYSNRNPWLWCEGLRVDTASPVDRSLVAQREDFVGDLVRLGEEIGGSDTALDELRKVLEPLFSRREVRELLEGIISSDDELKGILAAAEDECLAALVTEEEGA